MTYVPPATDMGFILKHLIGVDNLRRLDYNIAPDLIDSVLDGAGELAAGVFAPLNASGDRSGAQFTGGKVIMPKGFKEAYKSFADGGWNALPFPIDIGGMGLPWSLSYMVQEMFHAANISLALVTLLNQGAIELLSAHGPPEIKALCLPKLMSGAWTGTMNLTEPQAGSDAGAIRMIATPDGNFFRLKGQKIFISYGDHDMAENIVHFVLARLPDAPPGSKGLSLFLVPKILVKPNGALGRANDIQTISTEHKLGQHASPTCTLAYGDHTGAVGYLIGEPHGGMAAMFTMMNNARIGVGLQGLGLSERAYQAARDYAKTRIQGRDMRVKNGPDTPIIVHADVRRMLLTMRSQIEAARALAGMTGYMADRARMKQDALAERRHGLFMPIVKSWLTDLANEITSLAIQVFGGAGYIEETGAAQHYRDARVLAIYEGTNGIQANDLVFRKLAGDRGETMFGLCADMKRVEFELQRLGDDDGRAIRWQLAYARTDLETATQALIDDLTFNKAAAAAGASHYQKLAGMALGGLYLAQSAVQAIQLSGRMSDAAQKFMRDKITTARFYAEQIMPQTTGLRMAITGGHEMIARVDSEYF